MAEMRAQPELRYDPQAVELKWAARWQEQPELYRAEPATSPRRKYYVLEMLPYPSGALHMGHVRNYSIGDALGALHVDARLQRTPPHGLGRLRPAGGERGHQEQHAAARVDPGQHRAHEAADAAPGLRLRLVHRGHHLLPDYYRWNQWFFLRLYQAGLAYRKQSKVNWCPACATVLANEQVVGGCCWRHEDTPVEQRELEQWFLRITKYADELLRDLEPAGGLAGESPHHAAELDRALGRRHGRLPPGGSGREARRPDHRLHHAH